MQPKDLLVHLEKGDRTEEHLNKSAESPGAISSQALNRAFDTFTSQNTVPNYQTFAAPAGTWGQTMFSSFVAPAFHTEFSG